LFSPKYSAHPKDICPFSMPGDESASDFWPHLFEGFTMFWVKSNISGLKKDMRNSSEIK
jgi:hypothetical protein